MTQANRVLEYLESGKTITTLNAFKELGITRLAARVYELKCDGHEVKKNTITVVNRFDENCSIAEYYMESSHG